MTKRVPTGVSRLGVSLALAMIALLPREADAGPFFHEVIISEEGTFSGQFLWDNDVAVMRFALAEGEYDISARTTSWGDDGGFDPVLSLYYAEDEDSPLLLSTYAGLDGGEYPAYVDDISESDLNASFPPFPESDPSDSPVLRVQGGFYALVLTQSMNYPHENILFDFEWSADAFRCSLGPEDGECIPYFGGLSPTFAGSLTVTPIGGTPVPEPGTLSLLALGSLATAVARRRRHAVDTARS